LEGLFKYEFHTHLFLFVVQVGLGRLVAFIVERERAGRVD
jgi:hypothetical protein